MAIGEIDLGTSYISMLRGDVLRSEYLTYTPQFTFLPLTIAPLHHQMRVFVKGAEMDFLTDTTITPQTANYWSGTFAAPTAGVRCWGIRFTTNSIGDNANDLQRVAWVGIYDQDDVLITWNKNWVMSSEKDRSAATGDGTIGWAETEGGLEPNAFTTDQNTGHDDILETTTTIGVTNFPRAMDINRVGWTRSPDNQDADHSWQNVHVEVNVGTPLAPTWITFGNSTTHTINTRAGSAHTPGSDSITFGMYPGMDTDPIVPGTDDMFFDWTTNFTTPRDLDIPVPVITIVATIDNSSDRVVLLRETRQDRPWQFPVPGSRADGYSLWWYFEQIRFIVQELCELDEASNLIGTPINTQEKNDYLTNTGQGVLNVGGSSRATIDASSLILLNYAPGGNITPEDQIIVEAGNFQDGTSTTWEVLNHAASPGSDQEDWSIHPTTHLITFGGSGTRSDDVRVRRNTRTDQYWFDLRDVQGGWNSAAVDMVQQQARMMIEEACYLPAFYNDNPLSQSIFPRGWNWFRFVGTRNTWTVPGGNWGGTGGTSVWINFIEQVEGTNYRIEGPEIIWITPPPSGTQTTTIGVGGGGWGTGGVGGGGSGEGGETKPPVPTPTEEVEPVDWPGNNLPPDCGVSVAVSGVSEESLEAGEWEDDGNAISFSQGNASAANFGNAVMRIEITVTTANTVSDGGGGFHLVGAADVKYINKHCSPSSSNIMYSVAEATKLSAAGAWTTAEASGATGCLAPGGASATNGLYTAAACTVANNSPAQWRLWDSIRNITGAIAGGDTANVPFMDAWLEMMEMSDQAAAEGWTSAAGFTSAQFDDFLDPDTDFTDFDDPSPP